jgi:hypothetical protein
MRWRDFILFYSTYFVIATLVVGNVGTLLVESNSKWQEDSISFFLASNDE